MTVELFIPCFIDQLYPQTAFNTIKILEKAGCKVVYNAEQTCCGQPAYNAGFWEEAKVVGGKFLNDFSETNYIVSPSASCTGMVKNSFNDLFTNTVVHNKCRAIQSNIHELSDFLVNIIKKDYFGAELEGRAVYHDSCSGLRECNIKAEPRQLLSKVHGLELVEMKDTDVCCGFGGTFAVKFDGISSAMAEQKINNALEMGADYIISTDSSCLINLQAYIDQHNIKIRTMHIADVLTNGWGNV
ncbi:L-lactate dehydrogenase complex protein LldE [Daejeonella rubra]|uniref:L-lactate dehydrogenase complex protein LldE n=1 Tax=Daejeonella rubra TaxID=990371 RepID=A0A1G9UGZ1_9SPHI|nr:(Fe-S)-binding protein [Daejeonella rubra]SDM59179.1 L-lactate dehydrogenase complex protein LldE [Daejeonella rubra]